MTAEQCIAFLEALRAKQIRVKDNGWVESSCVLAKWTHKGHKDNKPSFGLSITPGGRSYFLCFSCRQGSAEELLQSLELYSHNDPEYDFKTCHSILTDETYVTPLPEYQEFATPATTFSEWPQYWVDSFQKVSWCQQAIDYLLHRGVSQTQWEVFDLRWDPKRQMVIAPYRDVFGRLAGARGRSTQAEPKMKHFDYTFQGVNNSRFCWYNEPVLNMDGPVVVCEGQFDVMQIGLVFPKVVGALTSKPTWDKMKKLADSPLVIHFPDRDEAGTVSVGIYKEHCQTLGVSYHTVWLDEGVKDPAECHPDYLRDRLAQVLI